MAKIVIATFGSYGDVLPYLALGKELLRRGHIPVIAAAEAYRNSAARAGITFFATRPDVSLDNQAQMARVMDAKRGAKILVRGVLVPSLRSTYADLERAIAGADLLISHVFTYAAPILGEKSGIPWISAVLAPMVFCSAYEPPAFAPTPWIAGLRRLGPGINSILLGTRKRISRRWSKPIRDFRRELGLPRGDDPLWEGQHSPYGVLAMFSSIFGRPQSDWPPNTTVCGFSFYKEEFDGDTSELDAFIAEGEPPVAFTLGSSAVQAAGGFYEEAVQAVGSIGRRAVLVAGPNADRLRNVPKNVFVTRTAPFHRLFPRCKAVVHAGGVGTIALALEAGVPQVIVPFSHDQFDNGNRVESMRCGIRLRKRPNSSAMASALTTVLARDATDITAAAVHIRAENGVSTACDAVERILAALYGITSTVRDNPHRRL